jgi:ElaB/YqjD/DUF883 family membrane-anchored ribosome-binding protein
MSASLQAELSSISSTADSIRQRVADLAISSTARANEELQSVLFEAERSLASAERHLARARRMA